MGDELSERTGAVETTVTTGADGGVEELGGGAGKVPVAVHGGVEVEEDGAVPFPGSPCSDDDPGDDGVRLQVTAMALSVQKFRNREVQRRNLRGSEGEKRNWRWRWRRGN